MDIKKSIQPVSDHEIKGIQRLLNSKNSKIQQGIATLICSLAEEDERYRERAGPGVIKPLIEMLQKEIPLKIVAAEALCNISNKNEHNCNLITKEGGLKHLISCLKIKRVILREWVTSTLCNIAFSNESNCLAMESEGGIKVLLELLKDASEQIVYAACSTLRNIAANSRHCANVIGESGGIPLLLELIKSDLDDDEDLITVAASTLCNLTFKNDLNCKKIVENDGAIKILLTTMKGKNIETQIAILNTLYNLALCEHTCRHLVDNSVISLLGDIEMSKVPEIRDLASKTLSLCHTARENSQRRLNPQKASKRIVRSHTDQLNLEKTNKVAAERSSKIKEVAAILVKKLTSGTLNDKEANDNANSSNISNSKSQPSTPGLTVANSQSLITTASKNQTTSAQNSPNINTPEDFDTSSEDERSKPKEESRRTITLTLAGSKKRDKTKR
jgi:hypothetical protein